jgi:hypothetical protein
VGRQIGVQKIFFCTLHSSAHFIHFPAASAGVEFLLGLDRPKDQKLKTH